MSGNSIPFRLEKMLPEGKTHERRSLTEGKLTMATPLYLVSLLRHATKGVVEGERI